MAEPPNENVAQTAFMCQFCDQQNVKWKCKDCGVYLCNPCKEKIHPRLKSSDKHRILSIQDIGKNQCYDNEPWYHGKMACKDAVKLLRKYKYMGDGVFLVRESKRCIGVYSLDVLEKNEPIHIRIYTKEESGHLEYSSGKGLSYDSLKDLINYFLNESKIMTTSGSQFTLTEPVPKEPICDK